MMISLQSFMYAWTPAWKMVKKTKGKHESNEMNECCRIYYTFKIYYTLTWLPFREIRKPVAFAIGQYSTVCLSGEWAPTIIANKKNIAPPLAWTKKHTKKNLYVFYFQVVTFLGVKFCWIGSKNCELRGIWL